MARFSGLLTFDRADRWWFGAFLGLVVAVQVVVRVAWPLVQWARGDALVVPATGSSPAPAGVAVRPGSGTVDVLVADATAGQRLADLVPGVLVVTLVAWATWLVLVVMRSVATGEPFADATVRRLRTLAAVLVIGLPVLVLVDTGVDLVLLDAVAPTGSDLAVRVDVPWQAIVAGLFIAMLAEAFVVGRRLREDVEGLV